MDSKLLWCLSEDLCFPLRCDFADVLSHYEANVELLQKLGGL